MRDLPAEMPRILRSLTGESQIRWLGPEKGVMHLAAAAVLNAALGSLGQARGPAALAPALLDCRRNSSSPASTSATFATRSPPTTRWTSSARDARAEANVTAALEADGYPAYITSAGWLGYDDDQVARSSSKRWPRGGSTSR